MTQPTQSAVATDARLAVTAFHAARMLVELAQQRLESPATTHNPAVASRLPGLRHLISTAVSYQTQAYIALRQGRYRDVVTSTDAAVQAATTVLTATRPPRPQPQPPRARDDPRLSDPQNLGGHAPDWGPPTAELS